MRPDWDLNPGLPRDRRGYLTAILSSQNKSVKSTRSGVRTHAVNRLLELESNPLDLSGILAKQRVMHHSGIEPESSAWKADILPLD